MHQALLIDEIIRRIFDYCYQEDRSTLAVLARTCTVWKDPALDHLWSTLSSLEPLLKLYPQSIEQGNSESVLVTVQWYASRVTDITLRGNACITSRSTTPYSHLPQSLIPINARAFPSSSAGASAMPNLTKARILSTCHSAQVVYALSTQLRHLTIDIGFKSTSKRVRLANSIKSLLHKVARTSPDLEHISLRGSMSMGFDHGVGSMNQLRVLSLRVGSSLTVGLVMKILLFPRLEELQIHASHLDAETLWLGSSTSDNHLQDHATFPSLLKLNIRATIPVVEFFLQWLQPNTLKSLRTEAESRHASFSWATIFQLLSEKTSHSLQELALEHLVDLQRFVMDPQPQLNEQHLNSEEGHSNNDGHGGNATQPPPQTLLASPTVDIASSALQDAHGSHLSFSTIQHLRPIRSLRRLVFDTTLPLNLCDDDIKNLVRFWPELEHLELGSFCSSLPMNMRSTYGITAKSLEHVATHLKGLHKLTIPVNLTSATAATQGAMAPSADMHNISVQAVLEQLTIAFPCTPHAETISLLRTLFPNLRHIDGLPEQEEQWHMLSWR